MDDEYLINIDIVNRIYTFRTTDPLVFSPWKAKLSAKFAAFGIEGPSSHTDEVRSQLSDIKTPKGVKNRNSSTPRGTPVQTSEKTTESEHGRVSLGYGDRTVMDAAAVEHMNLSRQIESIFETDIWYETKQSLKEYLAVKNSMSDTSLLLRRCERPCDMLRSDWPQVDPRVDPRIFAPIEALVQEILDRAQKESSDERLAEKLRAFAKFYDTELERMRDVGYAAARVPPTTLTIVARNSKRCIVSPQGLQKMDQGALQTTGHNPVRYISGMYWKEGPELPGIEFAVDLLYKRVMMRGSPPSVLVKRVQCDPVTLEPQTKLYQTSLGVEGHSLNDMDEKDPNWVSSIKRSNFCFMYIMALLTLPQDGKGDNIIVTKVGNKYHLTSIDNDHSFADPISSYRDSKKVHKHCINIRSILFCFPQAKEKFSKSVRKALLELSPELITVGWLEDLQKQNVLYDSLIQQGAFTKQEYEKSCLPIRLRAGTAQNFYDTLKEVQRLLLPTEDIRPDDIFAHLFPACHAYYSHVAQQHLKEKAKIPSLFAHGIFTGSPFEAYPDLMEKEVAYDKAGTGKAAEPANQPDIVENPLIMSSEISISTPKISEMLNVYNSITMDAFEENRTKLPYEELEALLQRMELSRLNNSFEVELINKLCSSTISYMHFTLIGSRLFSVANLRSVVSNSKSLICLELHHCSNVSLEEVIEVVSVARLKGKIIVSGAHINTKADRSSLDEEATLAVEVSNTHSTSSQNGATSRDMIKETVRFRQKNTKNGVTYITLIAEALEKIRSGDYMQAKINMDEAQKLQTRVLQSFKNEISAVLSKDVLRHLIVVSPCLPFIELLLVNQLLDVNQKNSAEGLSPWHMAIRSGNLDLCRLLLARGGAAMNAVTLSEQRNAMHLATLHGHVHLLEWMLDLASPKEAPDVNARDNWQHTPLSIALITRYASPKTQFDIVDRLVKAKSDLTLQYEKEANNSALHLALHYELFDVAKILIQAGSPLNIVNSAKQTALHVAVLRNAHISLLLEKGANPNSKDRYGKTPLMLAALNNNIPAIDALLSNSAVNANVMDESQYTALRMVVDSGNLAAIKLLVEKGKADPNIADTQGVTIMWRAASILYKSEPRTPALVMPPPPSMRPLSMDAVAAAGFAIAGSSASSNVFISNSDHTVLLASNSTTNSKNSSNSSRSTSPTPISTASGASSVPSSSALAPPSSSSSRDDVASINTSPLRRTRGGSLNASLQNVQLNPQTSNPDSNTPSTPTSKTSSAAVPMSALTAIGRQSDHLGHSRMTSSSVIDVTPAAALPMRAETNNNSSTPEARAVRPSTPQGRGRLQPPTLRPKDSPSSSTGTGSNDTATTIELSEISKKSGKEKEKSKGKDKEKGKDSSLNSTADSEPGMTSPRGGSSSTTKKSTKQTSHSSGKSYQRTLRANGGDKNSALARQTSDAQQLWVMCAEYLLSHKGDLKGVNEKGQPFITWLIQRIVGRGGSCGPIELQFVLDNKIPVESVDSTGRNFLHVMCATDWSEAELKAGGGDAVAGASFFVHCARLLLESLSPSQKRALLFQEDKSGNIALNLGFAYGAKMLELYIEDGGIPSYVSSLSKSDYEHKHPLFQALKANNKDPLERIAQHHPALITGSVLRQLKKKATDAHLKFLEQWDAKND